MTTRSVYLALLLAALHATTHAQVIKCTDASGRTSYQSTPCALAQGGREQKMAAPAQKTGNATTPHTAPVSAEQADMAAFHERMRARMCEVHRKNLSVLKESETMIVRGGRGDMQVADAKRRAAEIAQAAQRVADTCK
ncbi:MAG TPA: DUF4124 domain-containing protein [Telluria sp.]